MKRHLFVFGARTLQRSIGRETLDAVLVSAAFDVPVSVLFLGPAVTALRSGQNAGPYGEKSMDRQLSVLTEYGIDQIYLCRDALKRWKLDPDRLALSPKALDQREQAALIRQHEVVIYG